MVCLDLRDVTAVTDARNPKIEKSSLEATMQLEHVQIMNCPTPKPCAGPCSGYGTRCNCPPLIVLAIAAAQNIDPLPTGALG